MAVGGMGLCVSRTYLTLKTHARLRGRKPVQSGEGPITNSVPSISRRVSTRHGEKKITKLAITLSFFRKDLACRRGGSCWRRLGLRALAEAVLEAARHVSHVAHAARAVRAPPQRFLGPVKPAHLGARVAARGAHLLLQVEGRPLPHRRQVVCAPRGAAFRTTRYLSSAQGARGVRRLSSGARAGPRRWRVAAAGRCRVSGGRWRGSGRAPRRFEAVQAQPQRWARARRGEHRSKRCSACGLYTS